MSKKLPNKYFIYSIKNDDSYEELHARIGLRNELHLSKHVDIFPMVGAPKKGFKRRLFSKLSYINHRCYFIKKVNININYKNRPKRRIQARIMKLVLLPFNSKIFISIFNRLGKLYPIDKSETVYSICGLDSEIDFIPLEYLDNPEYFKFEDLNLPMPKEWDKYLKRLYGDYMTPRKKNYYNK